MIILTLLAPVSDHVDTLVGVPVPDVTLKVHPEHVVPLVGRDTPAEW